MCVFPWQFVVLFTRQLTIAMANFKICFHSKFRCFYGVFSHETKIHFFAMAIRDVLLPWQIKLCFLGKSWVFHTPYNTCHGNFKMCCHGKFKCFSHTPIKRPCYFFFAQCKFPFLTMANLFLGPWHFYCLNHGNIFLLTTTTLLFAPWNICFSTMAIISFCSHIWQLLSFWLFSGLNLCFSHTWQISDTKYGNCN